MGALTFDALLRSLKQGAPDPVYYLHGEEDGLKDEAVRVLLERAVDPAARDFNVDQRTAADLDPQAFNALVNTPPMLTATRAVVLRGMEQLRRTAKVRQELLRYVDSPNPTTVLVLVHGTAEPPDAELVRRAPRRDAPGSRRRGARAAGRGRRPARRAGARTVRHERRADAQRAWHRPRRHGARAGGARPRRPAGRRPTPRSAPGYTPVAPP